MPLRILEIITALDRGGTAKQFSLLATALPRDQFEVHVCALDRGGPRADDLRAKEIPVTVIGRSWKFDPAAYFRLKRQIAKLKPDIVHTWLFAANTYGRYAALGAGVKHVIAGEQCVDRWKVWHELALDRRLARRTERIVANSSGVVDFYVSKGLPAGKFVVIPSGVPPQPAMPSGSRQELLAELGLPADTLLIGAIGPLLPHQRLKDLIWSADLLKCVREDVHFVIIGDGPQRWRLERFRDQCEIQDRVHFLGERADLPRILPHLFCLWHASEYEGQSTAIMECMAAGVPVVATDIPGNRDLVVPSETGYLVPLGDRGEFARKTKVLLDDISLAQGYGAAGRKRIEQEFSIDQMIARYVELYGAIASG